MRQGAKLLRRTDSFCLRYRVEDDTGLNYARLAGFTWFDIKSLQVTSQ